MRYVTAAILFLFLIPSLWAQQATGASAAPASGGVDIKPPDGAYVTLEVDARDQDLLGLIRKLVSQFDDVDAKVLGGAGMNLAPADVSSLFRRIHRIRVISYSGASNVDPVGFFEPQWQALGFHRLVFSRGDETLLIMCGRPDQGMGLLYTNSDGTTVVRTDGMLDIPALGRIAGVVLKGYVLGQIESQMKTAPASVPAKKVVKHRRRHHVSTVVKPKPKPKPVVHSGAKGH
ncbi:MAG TPA: hypothetical protein VMI31_00055 [Fimbriimonadaceae bacterium]|nr:hypothetical protein [Fimbriimonadaceae bacterium]